MMAQDDRTIRVTKLSAQGAERDLENTTPEERMGMMWQLALDAWEMMGEPVVDPRLRRDVVRVIRGKGHDPE